jgi:hypothetical protein
MPTLEEVREQVGHLDGASKLLGRKEIKELPKVLWKDEAIEQMVQGMYGEGLGVLVATNKRLVFVDKGMLRMRVEDFPYDRISSIEYTTGMLMGSVIIYASGNKSEIKHVAKDQCQAFANYVRARTTAPSEHASAPVTAGSPPAVEQLERLAKLRDSGVLTPDEFEAEKRKVLAG